MFRRHKNDVEGTANRSMPFHFWRSPRSLAHGALGANTVSRWVRTHNGGGAPDLEEQNPFVGGDEGDVVLALHGHEHRLGWHHIIPGSLGRSTGVARIEPV